MKLEIGSNTIHYTKFTPSIAGFGCFFSIRVPGVLQMFTKNKRQTSIVFVRIVVILLLLFCITYETTAQRHSGIVFFSDTNKHLKCKSTIIQPDSTYLHHYFSRCITQFQKRGYLASRIDSIDSISIPITAYGVSGDVFKWFNLEADSITKIWLYKQGLDIEKLNGSPVESNRLVFAIEKSLNFFENNGYPFAKYSFLGTSISGDSISSQILLKRGPLIVFDTLYIKGNVKISRSFMGSYLGFKKGQNYSEKQVNQIDSKLSRLSYISIVRPSEVEFIPGKARIYTYINGKRSNRFSGLVGFTSGTDSKPGIKLTGSINLSLINALKNAESLSIRWYAQGEGSQNLKLVTDWPYLLGTNMALEGNFFLYKRDSTYLNLNPSLALGFFMERGGKISFGINQKNSRTIANSNLLNVKDFSTSLASIGYQYSNLPGNLFPVRGFEINSQFGVGRRRVKKSANEAKWDSNTQLEIGLNSRIYTPIYRELIIFSVGFQGKKMALLQAGTNMQKLLENEMLRIGGSEILRGFNEESIITDGYGLLETELHYRASKSAGLFVFFDKAYVSSSLGSVIKTSWPSGAGTGFMLEGGGGFFTLSYALGKGLGQDFRFRDAKLHIGYTASF